MNTPKNEQQAINQDESSSFKNKILEILTEQDNNKMIENLLKSIINEKGAVFVENKMDEWTTDYGEPILHPDNHKFTTFPINYHNIWQKYKEEVACFWKAEEIDFSGDYEDFKLLNADEQYFIEMILAFFAASDGIVNFNLAERFTREIKVTEILYAYQFQIMMENQHAETYALMLENIVRDQERRDFLFGAIKNIESIKLMADWALKWIESSKSFAYRVVAFAIVETVFFSGAFASIFWLKKYKNKNRDKMKGKPFMTGLVTSNKFIARDEGLHGKLACEVYSLLRHKLNPHEINEIMEEACDIAKKFMTDALPVRLIGMNSELMCQYIEYICDRLLVMLDYKKLYNTKNPFKFMETIGLDDKTNFFETRPHEYQDAYVMNTNKKKNIVLTDDF